MGQSVSIQWLQCTVAAELALTSCLSRIWQTLPTGSLAGSSSLTQSLKGEENVMCCVQEWLVAEEGLRIATLGGEGSLPSLLFW